MDSVGGQGIELRRIGAINDLPLYVDVSGAIDPDKAYQEALKKLFKAFIGKDLDGTV